MEEWKEEIFVYRLTKVSEAQVYAVYSTDWQSCLWCIEQDVLSLVRMEVYSARQRQPRREILQPPLVTQLVSRPMSIA